MLSDSVPQQEASDRRLPHQDVKSSRTSALGSAAYVGEAAARTTCFIRLSKAQLGLAEALLC